MEYALDLNCNTKDYAKYTIPSFGQMVQKLGLKLYGKCLRVSK
jgi:hypothetical protein